MKKLVVKWICLVALNVIMSWLLAAAIDFDSFSDTVAILLGILGIIIALVKIDHHWKIQGKMVCRQALLTGAIIKGVTQFFPIIDIFLGVICLAISSPLIETNRPLGVLLATLLVGTANFVLCFVGGLIVVSIYRSLPIVARRRQLKEDIISLAAQLKKEGEQLQLTAEHPLRHHSQLDKQVIFLLTTFHDHDWHLQRQIITVSQRTVAIKPPVLSSSMKIQIKETFLNVLGNTEEHPYVRGEAVAALRNSKDVRHIKSFLPLLSESDEQLRKNAIAALQYVCPLVHIVVFGNTVSSKGTLVEDPRHTLCNPDVSKLSMPMRKLKRIVIHAENCDLRLVEAFARYIVTHIGENHLKRQVTVFIQDKERQVPLGFWSPFSVCKHVDVYIANIEVVVFGTPPSPHYACQNSLYNPDVVMLTLPMSHLKQVNIYPETSDLRRLEEFCTYAVNHIGQKYLKRHVDVHIYGDLNRLHPNLQNVFTNLCKGVSVHDRDEILWC
jgi:hypothetical protein